MWYIIVSSIPAAYKPRFRPEVLQLLQKRSRRTGIQNILPGVALVQSGVIHMSKKPIWSNLNASISSGS